MTLTEYLSRPGNTATDLARKTGVSVSTITRAAKGNIWPSEDLMRGIFDHTQGAVTPNDFVGIAA
jgi:transcriptional regulator with XRE-family HTH domain